MHHKIQIHHCKIAEYESNSEDKQYQGEHHNTLFTLHPPN